MISMNMLRLSGNKQLGYNDKILLEYCIKITKTEYTSRITNRDYVRYKIKFPGELRKVLVDVDYLFFSCVENCVHIGTVEGSGVVYRSKIQKYCHEGRVEYNLYLSKKVFDLDVGDYFYWKVWVEDNRLVESVAVIVDDVFL